MNFLATIGGLSLGALVLYVVLASITRRDRARIQKYRLLFLCSCWTDLTPEEITTLMGSSLLNSTYSHEIHQLERAGLIARRAVSPSPRPPRFTQQLYRITPKGRAALGSPEGKKTLISLRRLLD